jgi:hypothetical protein
MERMHQLADEIRETFEDRGWRIEKATQLDPAFSKTRRSRSSLGRDLVLDAIEEATTRIGLGSQSVCGGGRDVIDLVDGADRRFRVRKADIDPDTGGYNIISTSDSILVITDAEPDALILTERWVLGYTVDGEGMVVDIFAGRVLGVTDDAVPRLKLGTVTLLGTSGSPTSPSGRGFQPADEDDLGGEFGQDDVVGDNPGEADAS